MRKFFCRNIQCERSIFTERLPTVVAPWARRSARLAAQQRQLGLDFGGEAGARASNRLGLLASGDTLLRMVRRGTAPARPTPRVLGVDDWAKRKGQTYGTILVDLESHEAVDLLPDRTADTLAQWLQMHPGIEIISRDRSGAYADGARRGAPEAVQVADRFHLLGNLREALEAVVSRQSIVRSTPPEPTATADDESDEQTCRQNATSPSCDDAVEEAGTHEMPVALPSLSPATKRYEPTRTANRARRKARYDQVVALHQQGLSQKAIALRLNLSAKTIRRWLRSGTFPERAPKRKRKRKTLLAPFELYLHNRWSDGCRNGAQLRRELCEQGYTGSRTAVADWVARRRQGDESLILYPSDGSSPSRPQPAKPEQTRSPRQISWLLIRDREKLTDEEKAFLDQLLEGNPSVAAAYRFSQEFRYMAQNTQVREIRCLA